MNHEVAAVEGSLVQGAYQETKDSINFSNKDLTIIFLAFHLV